MYLLLIGSLTRGYDLAAAAPVALLNPQLNVNDSSTILIRSFTSNPWFATYNVRSPVFGS